MTLQLSLQLQSAIDCYHTLSSSTSAAMSCDGNGCCKRSPGEDERLRTQAGRRREAVTRNLESLVSACENNATTAADPSQMLIKLRETQEEWQAFQTPLPSCHDAVLELLGHFRSQLDREDAPKPIVTGPTPLADDDPHSVRIIIHDEDWVGLERAPTKAKKQLQDIKGAWSEVASVAHWEHGSSKILEVFFEDEAKKEALVKSTSQPLGFTSLTTRLGLKQSVKLHQDVYEIKVFGVRLGYRKGGKIDLQGKLPHWSNMNEVTFRRATYYGNSVRLELNDKNQAFKLLDQGHVILDDKKYTNIKAWDRRWDRFQCHWCQKDANHTSAECQAAGTPRVCPWCSDAHGPDTCPVYGK